MSERQNLGSWAWQQEGFRDQGLGLWLFQHHSAPVGLGFRA